MASDHRIQQYLRGAAAREREVVRVGPFLATFDVRDPHPYLSYAIPDDGAQPTGEDVARLVDAYRQRQRTPRLEYLPSVAPAARRALLDGGFAVEAQLPGMVCTADALTSVPAPDGIAIAVPDDDVDWHAMAAAQHVAFGLDVAPADDPDAPARGRERLAAGGITLLARDTTDDAVVGGGVATVPADGVTEIAGIGVLASHRRRGIATALTAELARRAFAAGVDVAWLTPGDDGAHRVYARAGFADATTILHVSVPTPPASSAPGDRPASGG